MGNDEFLDITHYSLKNYAMSIGEFLDITHYSLFIEEL